MNRFIQDIDFEADCLPIICISSSGMAQRIICSIIGCTVGVAAQNNLIKHIKLATRNMALHSLSIVDSSRIPIGTPI